MVVWAIRVAFILVMFGVGYSTVMSGARPLGDATWLLLGLSIIVGVLVILGDYIAPRRKLTIFAGTFFGLLVGIVLAYALSFVVSPLADRYVAANPEYFPLPSLAASFTESVNLFVGAITCYLAISFVLQTKDDFRFIVPYVEFSRQTKGNRPVILDTSALIDGRVADVAAAGMFDSQIIVPRFVLNELQQVADSADKLKRNRGRRGLDVLKKLQEIKKLDITIQEATHLADAKETRVDQLIMMLATELNARVITTDFNLNKVAQVGGVDVINMNELANALKAEVLPGERRRVHIERPGEQANQGVGHLDDGTLVVVEHGKAHVGEDVEFIVTNTRQTNAGKMIFGRISNGEGDGSGAPIDAPSLAADLPAHADNGDEPPRRDPRPDDRDKRDPRRGGGGGGFSRSPRRGPPEPRA
jgi:uncharacterized protein YacL